MIVGVIFAILTGLTWASISVMMSFVARHRISVFLFYWIGNTLAAIIAWAFIPRWSAVSGISANSLAALISVLLFSGFVNVASQAMMVLTLKLGHNGISIVIRNCAAVIPFLVGILFWHNQVGICGFLGLAMILFGMAGLVMVRHRTSIGSGKGVSMKWLIAVIASLCFSGSFQLLNSLTARLSPETLDTRMRIPLLLTFCATGNCIAFWLSKKKADVASNKPSRSLLLMTSGWSLLAICSYFFMFQALDIMNRNHASALVFPIVIGVNIMAFSLYSKFRLGEKYTRAAILSLALCVAGIICITIK